MKKFITLSVVVTTILWTVGVAAFVPVASAATLSAGDLIKASGAAVYYYAADGKRYTFPTESTYKTWYSSFSGVKTITDNELSAIDLAGNVVVRPGTKLVKITTVPKVFAVEPNGKLKHVKDEASAKALYGADWGKKVIDIPDGFWVNYTDTGKQLDGTAYPAGQLVKSSSAADIFYVNADGSWSKIKNEAAMSANKWDSSFVVTTSLAKPSAGAEIAAAADTYVDVSQGGGAGTGKTATGNLAVSLNASTPAAQYVSKAAQNVHFAKFDFAATGGDVTVTQIVLERKGLGFDADLGSIRLYDGITKLGTDQSLNTNTHQVTFKNLSWKVSGTKTLTVKANVATSPSGTNDYLQVVSVSAGDSTVAGLPQSGNAMQFSNLTVGQFDVTAVTGTETIISGEKDKELGCWNFAATATGTTDEGFNIDSLKLTNIGTASSTEALNFSLKQGSTKIEGSDVAAMASNGTVTFDLTAKPYFIKKSTTKKICAYGDIAAGITVSKTLRFQIEEAANVAARGESSAGEVLVTYSSGTAFVAQSAKTVTIAQGSATISQNAAYAPTSGSTLVKGVASNKMAAYKLTAGSNEGVKLTRLKITMAGTGVANTDFSNWTLFKIVNGAEKEIPVSGSVSGLTVTYEDTVDGLLDVAKSQNETVVVRADVSTSFAGTESGVHVYIGADAATGNDTIVKAKGLASNEYITNGVTTSGVATGNAQTFTGAAYGALVVSKAAGSPTATTVAKGSSNAHLLDVNLYATGEDMTVTELVLTGASTGTIANDLSNVYITDKDGKQLGSTVATPSSGVSTFSFSLNVPKDTNVVVKAYGTIPTGATSSAVVHLDMLTAGTDITTSGVASGATITETGTAVGSNFTIGGPTITAAMSTSPIATSYVVGSSGVTMGKLILTAGTTEDVKITSVKVSADDAASIASTSSANSNITNVYLKDAVSGAQYGTKQNFTDGTPDYISFTGIDNLTLTKGQSATINVIVDFPSGSATYYAGVKNPTTDITGVGMSSNASLAAADINSGTTTAIASAAATITANGDIVVAKSADMPAAAQLVSGTTGVEVAKYKLTASYEDVDITVLPLYYSGTVANIDKVKLYKDGAIIGDVNGYKFTSAALTVSFAAGTFVVEKDKNVVLTIKADVNPKAQVTTATSNTNFGIGDADGDNSTWGAAGTYNMTAKGVSSGASISSINDADGNVWGSNNFSLHKGVLKITKNTASPSGTATANSVSQVLKLDLQAVGDDITINEIEFTTGGTCDPTGTSAVTLKSSDLNTTYATVTAGTAWLDQTSFSVGDTAGNSVTFSTTLSIAEGTTKTIVVSGDTNGCTVNETLQLNVAAPSAANKTVAGVEYEDSSGTDIDLASTKELPVTGGSLVF